MVGGTPYSKLPLDLSTCAHRLLFGSFASIFFHQGVVRGLASNFLDELIHVLAIIAAVLLVLWLKGSRFFTITSGGSAVGVSLRAEPCECLEKS